MMSETNEAKLRACGLRPVLLTSESDGMRFEPARCRAAIAALVRHLCTSCPTKSADPLGLFALVTQGRQTSWVDAEGKTRTYSACEDLPQTVFELLSGGIPSDPISRVEPVRSTLNRAPNWVPGANMLRLRNGIAETSLGGRVSDCGVGDTIQVQGTYGTHTLVICAIDPNGVATCGQYGQFFEGANGRSDHGGNLAVKAPSARLLLRYDLTAALVSLQSHGPAWAPATFTDCVEVD